MTASSILPSAPTGVATNLAARLRAVAPEADVVDASERLTAYSHDGWPLSAKQQLLGRHEYLPEVAVVVRLAQDVPAIVKLAAELGVPVTPRGLGSSVVGSPLPTRGGIVLDLSGLDGEPAIDKINHTVTVPAGVRGDVLEAKVNAAGFTLGHSPQSLDRSTVAGWIATLATGQLSSRYGGIENLAVGFKVVLADGSLVNLRNHPRAALGPDLRHVFLGSEGTLGIIVEATLKLFPLPESRLQEAYMLPNLPKALEALRGIAQSGLRPSLVRLYDVAEARHAVQDPLIDRPVMFLGTEGIASVARAEFDAAVRIIGAAGGASIGAKPVEAWLARRYNFSTIEGYLRSEGGYAETIEVAADWSGIQTLYTRLTQALAPLSDEVLGHFSHVYEQGTSLYVILLGRASNNQEAADRIRAFWHTAMTVTAEVRGELSHHHGAGLARKPYLVARNAGVTDIGRRIKGVLDPQGIFNPGKLFDR